MRLWRRTTDLWPGFGRAWLAGQWPALLLAIGFSAALNVALVMTVRSGDHLGRGWWIVGTGTAWVLVLGLWSLGYWHLPAGSSMVASVSNAKDQAADADSEFRQAQHEYLKGHWLEAELLVGQRLSSKPDDVEARLLLASIQRRTRRFAESGQTLMRLSAAEQAAKWRFEIETEQRLIDELESDASRIPEAERKAA